jgi:hypothetical protein
MAIEAWVEGHSTSPMMGIQLPHLGLTPNLALRSAVKEWLETHRVAV